MLGLARRTSQWSVVHIELRRWHMILQWLETGRRFEAAVVWVSVGERRLIQVAAWIVVALLSRLSCTLLLLRS